LPAHDLVLGSLADVTLDDLAARLHDLSRP
jgi:hypothetical protein